MKSHQAPGRVERKHTVALRVSSEEKRDIEAAAQDAHVGVSAFLRNLFYATVAMRQDGRTPPLLGAMQD